MDINDRKLLAITLQAEAGNQGIDGMMDAKRKAMGYK
jgi:hypothetical protein|tara:strand:+ start:1975 stop:2085 length:111 start_codon:yes stop_codon:yes gene_type:complete